MPRKPNILVILVDDLRYDEFGAGGHPYMKTPNIDRIALEGALFERAFHTTLICSPNRASIMTGQYVLRHGIIDNVARDRREFSSAQLPPGASAAGLRDGPHRQVAHGQQRQTAARLRPLDRLRWAWPPHESAAEREREFTSSTRVM